MLAVTSQGWADTCSVLTDIPLGYLRYIVLSGGAGLGFVPVLLGASCWPRNWKVRKVAAMQVPSQTKAKIWNLSAQFL
jgi:hypothetical protein